MKKTPGRPLLFNLRRFVPSCLLLLTCLGNSASDLLYSTYLGGEGNETPVSMKMDANGNIYLLGTTESPSWLTNSLTSHIISTVSNPSRGIFVIKFVPASGTIVYRAIISGNGQDTPVDLAVDSLGAVTIAGTTDSAQFPGAPNGFGGRDLFIARLSPDGSSITSSTLLGGPQDDTLTAFSTDPAGNLLLVGKTESPDFPLESEQPGLLFLAKLNPTASAFLFSQKFGGSSNEEITSISVGPTGHIFFGGHTSSPDFPVTLPPSPGARMTAFWGRVNSDGSSRILRIVPGEKETAIASIVFANGNITGAGWTDAVLMPESGTPDGLVFSMDAELDFPKSWLYLGGSKFDEFSSISTAPSGRLFAAGRTASTELAANDGGQSFHGGGTSDALIHHFDPLFQSAFVSYLGSSGNDFAARIMPGSNQDFFVFGATTPRPQLPQFPTTSDALKRQVGGGANRDLFLARFSISPSSPSNDSFASSLELAGSAVTTLGNSTLATREAGEPLHASQPGSASLWWHWTAPRSGPVVVTTADSSFDTLLSVYTGSSLATLVPFAANDNDQSAATSWLTFQATAGTIYRIAVDGTQNHKGSVLLSLSMDIPPNDDFVHATLIAGLPVTTLASNTNATSEPGEPPTSGEPYAPGNSVWFKWVAPSSQKIKLVKAGIFSGLPVGGGFAVFTGNQLSSLSRVADDNAGYLPSFAFRAIQGETYYILMDGIKPYPYEVHTVFGEMDFILEPASSPANDDFAQRTSLPATFPIWAESTLSDATVEPGEPFLSWESARRTVWWAFTPAATGVYTIRAKGTKLPGAIFFEPHIRLELMRGTSFDDLQVIAANSYDFSDPEPRSSRITLKLEAGVPIVIRTDGHYYSPASGRFTLEISRELPLRNDDRSQAILLTGTNLVITAHNKGTTREPEEPGTPEGADATLWWKWVAPESGTVLLDGANSSLHWEFHKLVIEAFELDAASEIHLVGQNYSLSAPPNSCRYICFDSLASFRAEAGRTYFIRLSGYSGAVGFIDVSLRLVRTPANDNMAEAASLESKTTLVVSGSNLGATREFTGPNGPEPYHVSQILGFQTLWWRWTAPINGTVRLQLSEEPVSHILAAYPRVPNADALPVASNQDNLSPVTLAPSATFLAEAGKEYFIVLDTLDGPGSPFQFTLEQLPSLQLVSPTKPTPAGYSFLVRGASTNSFVVEFSTNLTNWSSLSTNQLINGSLELNDPEGGKNSARFYRAREL